MRKSIVFWLKVTCRGPAGSREGDDGRRIDFKGFRDGGQINLPKAGRFPTGAVNREGYALNAHPTDGFRVACRHDP